jgi:hypothetical protein
MLLRKQKPDWDTIFKGKRIKYLVSLFWIIIRNNPSDILRFNYSDLAKDFEKPILIRELDINKYPVFGFAFIESAASNTKELNDILTSDLRKYIVSKQGEFNDQNLLINHHFNSMSCFPL